MSKPTSASYGSVPPGFVCGQCGRPLSTKWIDACKRCGARFIEHTPRATANTPDPMGDSPAMKRFQTLMYIAVVMAIVGGVVIATDAGPAVFVGGALLAAALGWVSFKRLM